MGHCLYPPPTGASPQEVGANFWTLKANGHICANIHLHFIPLLLEIDGNGKGVTQIDSRNFDV
jgi:hypothetical protein